MLDLFKFTSQKVVNGLNTRAYCQHCIWEVEMDASVKDAAILSVLQY